MGSLLTLLLVVLSLAVIAAVLVWAIDYIETPPPFRWLAKLIVVIFILLACIWVLSQLIGGTGLHLGFG